MLLQGQAPLSRDFHGKGGLLPLDSGTRWQRRASQQAQRLEGPLCERRFQRPGAIEEIALIDPTKARSAGKGRVAKGGDQQQVGGKGASLQSAAEGIEVAGNAGKPFDPRQQQAGRLLAEMVIGLLDPVAHQSLITPEQGMEAAVNP